MFYICVYDKKDEEINLLHDYNEDLDDWSEDGKKSYIEGKNNINEKNIEIYININIKVMKKEILKLYLNLINY